MLGHSFRDVRSILALVPAVEEAILGGHRQSQLEPGDADAAALALRRLERRVDGGDELCSGSSTTPRFHCLRNCTRTASMLPKASANAGGSGRSGGSGVTHSRSRCRFLSSSYRVPRKKTSPPGACI